MKWVAPLLLAFTVLAGFYSKDSVSEAAEPVLIRFCISYIAECNNSRNEFIMAAQSLSISYLEIDCSVNPDICIQHQINIHPTIAIKLNGTLNIYIGDEDAKSIRYGILNALLPKDGKESTREYSVPTIVAGSKYMTLLGDIAEKVPELRVIESGSRIVYKYKNISIQYDGDDGGLKEFVLTQLCLDYPMKFGWKSYKLMMNYNHTFAILFYKDNATDSILREFWAAASDTSLIFAEGSPSTEAINKIMPLFSIQQKDLPLFVIANNTNMGFKTYRMKEPITSSNIAHFIKDFQSHKLKRFVRSEETPTQNGIIIKLVGSTFDREVIENNEYVVVKYYNPYCKHCIEFKPLYQRMAEKYAQNAKFTEIDLTKNDVDGIISVPIPSVYLYLKNKKQSPVIYQGTYSESSFSQFLEDNLINYKKDL